MSDPTLARANWSEAQVDAYAEAAARLCHCEGLCACGWDDPDSLAMRAIERTPDAWRAAPSEGQRPESDRSRLR